MAQPTQILAEMVASVASVDVAEGDSIAAGQTLAILESMKMEIPVLAEHAGTITKIHISPGDVIQEGDPLFELG